MIPPAPIPRPVAVASLVLFVGLLLALPIARQATASHAIAVFDSFYRAGSLVFGGGHVVLPLLQAEVVPPGWVTNEEFIAGYGAAQAVRVRPADVLATVPVARRRALGRGRSGDRRAIVKRTPRAEESPKAWALRYAVATASPQGESMRVATLLAVVMLLAACTRVLDVSGTEWRRANSSIQQITFDEVECARDSEHKGDLPPTIVGGILDKVIRPLEDWKRGAAYDRCMRERGYESASATSARQ